MPASQMPSTSGIDRIPRAHDVFNMDLGEGVYAADAGEFMFDDPDALEDARLYADIDFSPTTSGSRDSQSDSSKRAASSSSAHTSFPGGDMLAGKPTPNTDWVGSSPLSETSLQQPGSLDGTVDPCSIEKSGMPAGFSSPTAFMGQSLPPNISSSPCSNLSPRTVGRNGSASAFAALTPSPIVPDYAHTGSFQLEYAPQPAAGPSGSRSRKRQPVAEPLHLRTTNTSRETSPHDTGFLSNGASPGGFFDNYDVDLGSNSHVWAPNRLFPQMPFFPNNLPPEMPAMPQMPGPAGVTLNHHQAPWLQLNITADPPWKSRVETQLALTITVTPTLPGIDKLRIARHCISKVKHLDKANLPPSPGMLELHVHLVSSTAMKQPGLLQKTMRAACNAVKIGRGEPLDAGFPEDERGKEVREGGEVRICAGCILRERKRSGRKKKTKLEDEQAVLSDEHRRIIVFNCPEIKELKRDETNTWEPIKLPMRIACYCRHHNEKTGFQAIFTLADYKGDVIGQTVTPHIMITDDHKGDQKTNNSPPEGLAPQVPTGGNHTVPSPVADLVPQKRSISANNVVVPLAPQALQPHPNRSRPASPSRTPAHQAKRRKGSGTPKVPPGLTMTALQQAPSPESYFQDPVASVSPTVTSRYASPLTPENAFPVGPEQNLYGGAVPFPINPSPMPDVEPGILASFEPSGLENLNGAVHSTPASMHQSRSASPSALLAIPDVLGGEFYHHNPQPLPKIHKVIPSEGSKNGGTEVTVLGSDFDRNLEVMFGQRKAVTTTYWGPQTLVCLVPPSAEAGAVDVTFKNHQAYNAPEPPKYRYVDDNEVTLLRTALKIVGLGMNPGASMPVREVAKRIIGVGVSSRGAEHVARGDAVGGPSLGENMDFESRLLRLLEAVDQDDRPLKPRLNLRRLTGQSMLHIACSMGLGRFVAGLIARGVNMDLRDRGGYTPLHFAALNSHADIVRRLVSSGADPTLRTLSGLTAADVATSPSVLQILRAAESYMGSRSTAGSHISAVSSTASLRSLRAPISGPPTEQATSNQPRNYEESPGYSPDVHSDDGSLSDDEPWPEMRRPSNISKAPRADRPLRPHTPDSPAASMAGLKDQFAAQLQQLQQITAQLPQIQQIMAQLPQISGRLQVPAISNLPEYQAAVLQRLAGFATMVSALGGARPGSAGEQSSATKELDSRWWDLSSFKSTTPPPPAYEEIFPQQQGGVGDKKQADTSLTLAEAEAKADAVCEAMFDRQPAETAESSSSSSTASEESEKADQGLPPLLQIGRKHAITKEQQEILRRAHAERLRGLSRDRNLFFIWIPLLLIVVGAMVYGRIPGWLSVTAPSQPIAVLQDRIVEV